MALPDAYCGGPPESPEIPSSETEPPSACLVSGTRDGASEEANMGLAWHLACLRSCPVLSSHRVLLLGFFFDWCCWHILPFPAIFFPLILCAVVEAMNFHFLIADILGHTPASDHLAKFPSSWTASANVFRKQPSEGAGPPFGWERIGCDRRGSSVLCGLELEVVH